MTTTFAHDLHLLDSFNYIFPSSDAADIKRIMDWLEEEFPGKLRVMNEGSIRGSTRIFGVSNKCKVYVFTDFTIIVLDADAWRDRKNLDVEMRLRLNAKPF